MSKMLLIDDYQAVRPEDIQEFRLDHNDKMVWGMVVTANGVDHLAFGVHARRIASAFGLVYVVTEDGEHSLTYADDPISDDEYNTELNPHPLNPKGTAQ